MSSDAISTFTLPNLSAVMPDPIPPIMVPISPAEIASPKAILSILSVVIIGIASTENNMKSNASKAQLNITATTVCSARPLSC